jgi:hypothetical protein
MILLNDPERKAANAAAAIPEPGSTVCRTLGGWTGGPVGSRFLSRTVPRVLWIGRNKVGRRMGRDEVGTLRTPTAHRTVMDRPMAEHGGRIANMAIAGRRTPKEIDRYGRDYMGSVASEQGYRRYLVWRAQNGAVIDADVELAESGAAVA